MRRIAQLSLLIGLAAIAACAPILSSQTTAIGDDLRLGSTPSLRAQIVGREFDYAVEKGDSLSAIGAKYGVGVKALAAQNGITNAAKLRPGQVLRVDNRHIVPGVLRDGILINLPQRLLFLFEDGRLVAWYPVAVGQPNWQTPTGSYKIITRETDPVWDVPVSIQREMRQKGERVRKKVPPGPDNPLGEYWMGLSATCCGIHSTNAPSSVYQFKTHGCVRMSPDDAEDLFHRVEVGIPVEIIYDPVLMARNPDGTTFMEVHPDIYRRGNHVERATQIAESHGLPSGGGSPDWEETLRDEEGIATIVAASSDR